MAEEWSDLPIQDEWNDLNIDTMPIGTGPVAKDFVKSTMTGMGEALLAAPQVGADARELASDVAGGLTSKPKAAQALSNMGRYMPFIGGPTTQERKKQVEGVTGKFYEPQFLPGKYGKTAGNFLGSPYSYMGPGGWGAKAGLATMSGIGSQAGGDLGEAVAGAPGEAIGRGLGAVGPGLASARMGTHKPRATSEEVFETGRKNYDMMRQLPMAWRSGAADDIVTDIKSVLDTKYSQPNNAKVYGALDDWAADVSKRGTLTPHEFNELHSKLSKLSKKKSSQSSAAFDAQEGLSKYLANPTPGDIVTGHQYLPVLQRVNEVMRGNWAGAHRMRTVETARDYALLRAKSSGTGANLENAERQGAGSVLRNEGKSRGMNPEELAVLERVPTGNFYGNSMRRLGKLAPTGPVSASATKYLAAGLPLGGAGAAGAYGYGTGDWEKAAMLGGLGLGAKKLGERSTHKRTNQALEKILERTPHGQALPPRSPRRGNQPTTYVPGIGSVILNEDEEPFARAGRVAARYRKSGGGIRPPLEGDQGPGTADIQEYLMQQQENAQPYEFGPYLQQNTDLGGSQGMQRPYQPSVDRFPLVQQPDIQNHNNPQGAIPWMQHEASFAPWTDLNSHSGGGEEAVGRSNGFFEPLRGTANVQSQEPQTALYSNYDPLPSVFDNSWHLGSQGMTSNPGSYGLQVSGATPDWARIAPGPAPLYSGPTPQPYGGVGPMSFSPMSNWV